MHSKIIVSAPGKIHLMGEHAVVYGKPALLSAINLRLTVTIQKGETSGDEILAGDITEHINRILPIIKRTLSVSSPKPFRLTLISDIPFGYHLGSSATVAVAVTAALMKFYTDQFDKEKINAIAYEIEKLSHGTPSGGDNTAVTYGGFLQFEKKNGTKKLFHPLSYSFPKDFHHFFLIDTGKPESTKDMVMLVRDRFDRDPSYMQTVFNVNEKATAMIREAIRSSDEKLLLAGMRVGEKTLEDMGVVSEKIKPLIHEIETAGGSAKILGGGGVTDGVGFLLCYHRDRKSVETVAEAFHYPVQPITLGEEGVRMETK